MTECREWREFDCPYCACLHYREWVDHDRHSPSLGHWVTDPPTECRECGADMTDEEPWLSDGPFEATEVQEPLAITAELDQPYKVVPALDKSHKLAFVQGPDGAFMTDEAGFPAVMSIPSATVQAVTLNQQEQHK